MNGADHSKDITEVIIETEKAIKDSLKAIDFNIGLNRAMKTLIPCFNLLKSRLPIEFSARKLRVMGFVIPEDIPDIATAMVTNLIFEPGNNPGEFDIELERADFKWIDINITVE